ncbi:DUF1754-domain-containing protein [Ophiocordyceps camponoti-floridani]|uniref:DUF1754-domain-containing protein n=1 Tax=Ophiocordyceps camponoti-floridani TaxID=2030778 RepID=A0A8H4Q1W3_9HYPO|nr:DUF1754-domain-containing protein [Ophiocordyceps camponoti-floridani]
MPSDEYVAVGGSGALRLKGGKVQKHKKKKKTDKSKEKEVAEKLSRPKTPDPDAGPGPDDDDDVPAQKTESERRYEEAKKKRMLQMTQASGARPELLKTHKERGTRPTHDVAALGYTLSSPFRKSWPEKECLVLCIDIQLHTSCRHYASRPPWSRFKNPQYLHLCPIQVLFSCAADTVSPKSKGD